MENEKIFELLEKMYSDLSSEISGMKSEIGGMKSEIGGMKSEIGGLKSEIRDVKNTVTRIEHEHGKKLDALFDGYVQNTEQLKRIEMEVSRHEEIILRKIK